MKRKTKKKYKLKNKKLLVIIILVIILLFNSKNIKILYLEKTTDYNKETITKLLDNNISISNIKDENSETIANAIKENKFKKEYLDDYLNIKYQNQEDFIDNINNLLKLGYSSNEINTIYEKLENENIKVLLNRSYEKELTNILKLSYFKNDLLERYLDYQKDNTELDTEQIVTKVNIGLDQEFYTNLSKIEDPDNILTLVNKYYYLDSSYVPSDLVVIKHNLKSLTGRLRKEAATAFDNMCDEAEKENIIIYGGLGYRSYTLQKQIYNNYIYNDGFDAAEKYSARPGHSEHQLGLAIDLFDGTGDYLDEDDKEYTWLLNNSYKYGFIIRYQKGSESITGYNYEPWHIRYLGIETATEVYNQKVTYEEYLAKK